MKRKLAGAATMIVVACLVTGCGGGDKAKSAGATTTPPLTKAQFITRADAVCAKTNAAIRDAGAPLRAQSKKSGTLPKAKVAEFFRKTSLPTYDRMVQQLRDLTPPKADEAKIDGLVASLAGAIDVVKANPVKFADRVTADPFDDANQRARDYGMKVCGAS